MALCSISWACMRSEGLLQRGRLMGPCSTCASTAARLACVRRLGRPFSRSFSQKNAIHGARETLSCVRQQEPRYRRDCALPDPPSCWVSIFFTSSPSFAENCVSPHKIHRRLSSSPQDCRFFNVPPTSYAASPVDAENITRLLGKFLTLGTQTLIWRQLICTL